DRIAALKEADAARTNIADVEISIEKYKNASLTEAEAARIRDDLRQKLKATLQKCDEAIKLDRRAKLAWIQRVEALRLSANTAAAKAALSEALKRFPGDAQLTALSGKL